jgi:hypothetical protein
MIFELDQKRRGDWDHFQVRKIGFRALRGLSDEEKKALERRVRSVIIKLGS